MEEIEAQSFGRTWGWVKNYSIFPLWVKYPYKNVILSYCINHGAIYWTACTNQFNFLKINDVTDICITHSFCRYFKLWKVFLGRSESLLQDKSLKNKKEKQTQLSDEWNPCTYKDISIMCRTLLLSNQKIVHPDYVLQYSQFNQRSKRMKRAFWKDLDFIVMQRSGHIKTREQHNVTFQWD